MKSLFHRYKKNRKRSVILTVVVVAVVGVLAVNCCVVYAKTNDKRRELSDIQQEIDLQQQEIDELEYLIKDGNELEYIERIARENYGYVAPGERAFYDSSSGN